MGLIAICGVSFALLTTPFILVGAGVLIVVPGFVLERVRGGTGILGGSISGCLIPMVLLSIWAAIEYLTGIRTLRDTLDFFPALYLVFVVCLTWSSFSSCLLYVIDRRLQGRKRSDWLSMAATDPGIQFLPDEERSGGVPEARTRPVPRVRISKGASEQ
jgi:hypothetical protein